MLRGWHEISCTPGMNDLLQTLLRIQALDFGETSSKKAETEKADLRALVPPQVLGHYDRLVARGKKGVALVRNQVCTGCHMRLPIGTINTLMHGLDIQLCDSCGRYLALVESAPAEPAPVSGPTLKPAVKTRKRKTPAHATS